MDFRFNLIVLINISFIKNIIERSRCDINNFDLERELLAR